jgi:hypothetical protein
MPPGGKGKSSVIFPRAGSSIPAKTTAVDLVSADRELAGRLGGLEIRAVAGVHLGQLGPPVAVKLAVGAEQAHGMKRRPVLGEETCEEFVAPPTVILQIGKDLR